MGDDTDYTEPLLRRRSSTYGTEQDDETTISHTTSKRSSFDGDRDDAVVLETSILGRNIGWSSAYIIVISRVVGSGIFAMPGTILKTVESPVLALVLWIAGAVIAWCGLAISIEYGCMLPRSGGVKVYLEYTYRWPRFFASTMVAVQAVLFGFTASNCIVFAKYVLFALKYEITDLTTKTLAVGLLTLITVVHSCFYRTGIWIQNVLGWAKVLLIIFMALTALFVVLLRKEDAPTVGDTTTSVSTNGTWLGSGWAWSSILTAFFKVSYSYAGLENVNTVLNEVKDPVRTLKSVGPAALLTACVTYVLVNLAYLAVVPIQEIKQSGELIAALFFEKTFGAGIGNVFFPSAIAVSAAGNVMVVTFSLARLNQEVARQGFLPFADILASSKPFNAPMGGLLVHYVPSLLVITLPPSSDVYAFIADVEGYAGSFYALAIAAGLLALRKRRPELPRPFRAWLPVVWLRIGFCFLLIAAPFFPPNEKGGDVSFFYAAYALVAVAVLLFGVFYWYFWTVALPSWRGYQLESEPAVLPDGTTINRLVKKHI